MFFFLFPEHCYIRGKYFDHGEFYIEQCNNCTCDDGSMRCVKIECPKLNCSPENIIKVKDECCSVCKGDDDNRKDDNLL